MNCVVINFPLNLGVLSAARCSSSASRDGRILPQRLQAIVKKVDLAKIDVQTLRGILQLLQIEPTMMCADPSDFSSICLHQHTFEALALVQTLTEARSQTPDAAVELAQ